MACLVSVGISPSSALTPRPPGVPPVRTRAHPSRAKRATAGVAARRSIHFWRVLREILLRRGFFVFYRSTQAMLEFRAFSAVFGLVQVTVCVEIVEPGNLVDQELSVGV